MSSEESLYSDADCKNNNKNKMKQRKPDMQMYVPRAKRIEDQVKQRMSAESAVIGGEVAAIGETRTRFSVSPSPEPGNGKGQARRGFRLTWEEKEITPMKIKPKKSSDGDRTGAKAPILPASGRKGVPPQQPQTNKLPSQVIQEMMKRHNINISELPENPFPDLEEHVEPASTEEYQTEPMGLAEEPAPTAEGDSSILNFLPGSYQDFVNEDIAAASQRFASTQPALMSEYRHSVSSLSTSPVSSDAAEVLQLPSRSGGRGSPCLDAEDLEVKMINESFEETQRQIQLLGSEAVKKAWIAADANPNPVLNPATSLQNLPNPSSTGIINTVPSPSAIPTSTPSQTSTSSYSVEPVVSSSSTKPVPAISTNAKPAASESGKLTWAGWGAKKIGTVDRIPSSTKAGPETTGNSLTSSSFKITTGLSVAASIAQSGAPEHIMLPPASTLPYGSMASQLQPSFDLHRRCETAQQASAIIGAAEDNKYDVNDTKEMDILSAAMIEKVLSDDGDDFDAVPQDTQVPISGVTQGERSAATAKLGLPSPKGQRNLADIWSSNESADPCSGANTSAIESWEDLFGESGEQLIAQLMQQTKASSAKEKTDELTTQSRPEIDYFTLQPREVEMKEEEFSHVLEAYGFPPSLKGDEMYLSLRQLYCREFRIEWVDDTHALVVFSSANAAREACESAHPLIKLRPMAAASAVTKSKAKTMGDSLQPYLRRPDTSASLARRLVEGHLGKRSELSVEQRKREREQLQHARDERKIAAQQRQDAWEGRL